MLHVHYIKLYYTFDDFITIIHLIQTVLLKEARRYNDLNGTHTRLLIYTLYRNNIHII